MCSSICRVVLSLLFCNPSPVACQTVHLANGVQMPSVGLGTWEFNNTEVTRAVQNALAVGFQHIDCAHNYNNQVGIGAGLAASGRNRDEVFITSKVPGCGIQGLSKDDCFGNTLKLVADDIAQLSSSGFPLKYLDLLLIHFPPCMEGKEPFAPNPFATPCRPKRNGCTEPNNCRAIAEQWRALEQVYHQGLARAIGVSDFCSACFKCLGVNASVMPMLNNVQFHLGMGPDPQGTRSFAEKNGMVLMAWSPLGHGGRGSVPIFSRALPMEIAKAHNKSGAQVALKWILSHNVTLTTKSANLEHLAEDIDLFDWELTPAQMAALDSDASARSEYDTPSFSCNDPETEILV
eukprot:TRINITY_DN44328_c0_g1_i1.p1 TRINITY_DN44328_c0_g1~~TRINITY_DN44328_c0_g1_i1.p1  ORF type:complete len:348 (+),score=44.04 TRINITY_DN44328_c0_g1_i1:45-1088(+)